jgi:hypothetical protein
MGPGKAEEEGTAGLVVFLAESWRRVLTTTQSVSHVVVEEVDVPHIGFVPVAVIIPAITAALR